LAAVRVSRGYKRLHVLLRREGWRVNHKLVYRLYREERLALKRRRPKRRKSAAPREVRPLVSRANERWAMDFVHDVLADGRTIRILAVVDVFSRECVALVAKTSFRAEDVCRILSEAGERRGKLPECITVDNGSEFTSKALDHWAYWNRVRLDFSRPGKPMDNGHVEAFNGSCGFSKLCRRISLNSVASWGIWNLRYGLPPTVLVQEARGGCSGCWTDMPYGPCAMRGVRARRSRRSLGSRSAPCSGS